MPIPSSGVITLGAVQTEFGGTNPISLSEYYAGGVNVPSGTSGTNGLIPTSGQFAMSKFYGTAKVQYSIVGTYTSSAFAPSNPSVTWTLNSNGSVTVAEAPAGPSVRFNWINPNSGPPASTAHWIRVTGNTSAFTTSAGVGTWIATSANRTWSKTRTAFGSEFQDFTAAIATDSGGTNIVVSGTVSMFLNKES